MNPYSQRLHDAVARKQTPALVGLDPRYEQLPAEVVTRSSGKLSDPRAAQAASYQEFCERIIDIVSPYVPAVKPQAAFFEECGPAGMSALQAVIRYARKAGLLVICDAKRGDIGSTAEAYARTYLAGDDPEAAPYAADALTVNPYLGIDTLEPFVKRCAEVGGGLYVLVRTSNPESGRYQDRETDGTKLFEGVADDVEALTQPSKSRSGYGDIGAVVGATYPAELEALRERMPSTPFLVPGYGSQGGTSADVAGAFDANGHGALVNSSRGIIFAYRRGVLADEFGEGRWEEAVETATKAMIEDLRLATRASRLIGGNG